MAAVPRPLFEASPFTPAALETEFLESRLLDGRPLVRATCTVSALVAAARIIEQLLAGSWIPGLFQLVGFALLVSVLLACIAWSTWYTRIYLPVAQIAVPARNAVVAFAIGGAAAHGQLELLMVLPLMIVAPFFFLGLRVRASAISVAATVSSFVAATLFFGLDASLATRICVFLLVTGAACVLAARQLETISRKSFLDSRLIAELAQHDPLTGTKNRRVFDEHLARLWQQAGEDSRRIAVLLVDVDHFKAYNDRYGHQAGDQTLRRVAQALEAFACRPLDLLARYGGEEFAAVIYDVDAVQAHAIADRMRRTVGEMGIEHLGSRIGACVTVSVGVAVVEPTNGRRPRGALQLADEALYKAKLKGRNTVELMDEADYRLMVTGVFAVAQGSFGKAAP